MRYIKLIGVFVRASFQNEAAYRLNFFMNVLSAALGLFGSLGGVYVLFANNARLNGWTMPETLAVLGVYMLVQALKNLCIGPGMNKLGGMDGEIQSGAFDFTLLKPLSKQYYVSVREWSLWSVFHVILGGAIIGWAVKKMDASVTPASIVLFILALFIALVLLYAVMLLLSATAFWYKGTFLLWILEDLLQTGRYPIALYPGAVRLFLTWVFPVAFIVSVPAQLLTHTPEWGVLAGGAGLAAGLFILAAVVFNRGMRRYSSASS